MRKMLRSFLAWIDARFPERVVVTQAEFVKMRFEVDAASAAIKNQETRLLRIESEINKFNVSMGFGGTLPKGVSTQFQR